MSFLDAFEMNHVVQSINSPKGGEQCVRRVVNEYVRNMFNVLR